ncbi:ribonuclease D, partial [Escherichia coli]|nr:ribonuclease D [Escherichia coli]
SSELDQIAAGQRDVKALSGWRAEVFGNDAMRLCRGELALAAKGSTVKVVEL